jgi:tryptophan-rich sensory protein
MTASSTTRFVAICAVSLSAGLIGWLAVPRAGFTTWYAALQKPAFTPPS